jgi:hypothetical protein
MRKGSVYAWASKRSCGSRLVGPSGRPPHVPDLPSPTELAEAHPFTTYDPGIVDNWQGRRRLRDTELRSRLHQDRRHVVMSDGSRKAASAPVVTWPSNWRERRSLPGSRHCSVLVSEAGGKWQVTIEEHGRYPITRLRPRTSRAHIRRERAEAAWAPNLT